jgi:hypothetical protein
METGTVFTENRTAQINDTVPDLSWAWKDTESINMKTLQTDLLPEFASMRGPNPDGIEMSRYIANKIGAVHGEPNSMVPKTVGGLYGAFVEQYHAIHRINTVLELVNMAMNEYADENNLCSAYDEAVNSLNDIIITHFPTWGFRFEPRQRMYNVIVERTRTVKETTVVYVTGTTSATAAEIKEIALNDAQYIDDEGEWSVQEEEDDDYLVVDYSLSD